MSSAGDDFVRILMTLTSDVEWFDSLVVLQRTTLQEAGASPDAVDHDRLSRHSERLSLEAAEMVAHAHHALDQLRRLSEGSSRARSGS